MTASTRRSQISIRVSDEVRTTLELAAAQDRRSISNLAELLIADALRDRDQQTAGGRRNGY
jgi:hypothetical protein